MELTELPVPLRIPNATPFCVLLLSLIATKPNAEEKLDFNRDVRPILSDKCFFCHGPDEHERGADLRLDTPEAAFADLGGYSAIVAGKPNESEIIYRILDQEDPMPPEKSHKTLKPEEISILTRWVEEGAEYSEPWAYVPPKRTRPPSVENRDWPENWVDQFVLSRLEKEGLTPSPDADPVTLIRRLHFDLTGLPPNPQDVDDFVSGKKTLESVVDELLASPHFGERLAIYWLDLVRYADTVGYHGDQDHNISPYRDYVIRAFNNNLPFDQFTTEQLAGDLLPDPDKWQKIATGYNRLLQTSHEGGIQKKEYDAIYAADRVRNVSAVWMGATVGCAQCHDHKYDPYTIKDHYALAAFFSDIHDVGYNGNSLPTNRPPEMLFFHDELEKQLAEVEFAISELLDDDTLTTLETLHSEKEKLVASVKKSKDEEKTAIQAGIAELQRKINATATAEERDAWTTLTDQKEAIQKQGRPTMITVARPPREMRILPRGNWQDDTGDVVTADVPDFMGSIKGSSGAPTRLDLAHWLTDSETGSGGLTARVFANRFWYLFFGTGISRSLDDFGGQGVPPENPELLDNLAIEFVSSGWDVKKLVRLLVTSRSYRQSSITPQQLQEIDPHNQLVARQSRYRLPAELIRDNALAVSGLLVREIGGDSAKPYQPAGYFRHLNFPTRTYHSDNSDEQWRRGLYVHWQRMFLHPMMKAMDAPSREECTAQRPRSNTPNAALVLLNDPTFLEAARVFAVRVLAEGGSKTDARLDFAFRETLSRLPDEEERSVMTDLLQNTMAEYEKNPKQAAALLENGIATSPENTDVVELASWTAITRALLNLNETVTRN